MNNSDSTNSKRARIILNQQEEFHFIADISRDYHFDAGFIKAADLQATPDGGKVKTNKDAEFNIFDATNYDKYKRLKRGAAIILLKEAGAILANTLVDKDSVCVDAGAGSGALTCFLAKYTGKVYCYDIREDHLDIARKNAQMLGLNNVEFAIQDVYNGIPAKGVDLITLDVPEPHKALDHVATALKPGKFLVCYLPNANQVQSLCAAILQRNDFIIQKTIEIIEREWEVNDRKNRPANTGLMHTGFLTFIRRI